MKFNKIFFIISFLLAGCINLPIGKSQKERSTAITVVAPSGAYEKTSSKHVDQGWIHSKNGTTISYLSDCGDTADISLKQMELTALSGLRNLRVLEQNDISFSERKALRSKVQGDVDGVTVNVELLVTQKNGCRYTFTLTGFPPSFSQAQTDFNQFLKGVRIQ